MNEDVGQSQQQKKSTLKMKKRNKKELSIFKEFNHKMKEKKPFEIDNSQNEFI